MKGEHEASPPAVAPSYRGDLETAVRDSLAAVRRLIPAGDGGQAVGALSRQVERLLAEQRERLAAINRDLEAFNDSVAFDLRGPLARIAALTRLLRERYLGRFDPDVMDYLERICRSSEQMNELIEALLELSQLSYQHLKLEMVDLSAIVSEAADELRQGTPGRRAEFRIQPHIRTFGDATLLGIALKNLLTNAWKFTRTRETACIEFGSREVGEDSACFVRDNGVGFDMRNAGRMFEAFQRLHNSADYPGHGIGLTTVQRIINRHGGRIWAEGEVGKGATFYFTLKSCTA